jgi:hypothetical protein
MKTILLTLSMLLLCSLAIANPPKRSKSKKFNNGSSFCPHTQRQVFGMAVGWERKMKQKKQKPPKLGLYRQSIKKRK